MALLLLEEIDIRPSSRDKSVLLPPAVSQWKLKVALATMPSVVFKITKMPRKVVAIWVEGTRLFL